MKEHPDAYLREISAHFSVGITTIWTALKRLGVKYKKKRKIYREADPKKRAEFAEFLKKHEKNELVFVDESGIDRFLYRERCRALKGEQIYASVPGRKFERLTAIKGVGEKTAMAILIDVPDVEHFEKSGQFAAFACVTHSHFQS